MADDGGRCGSDRYRRRVHSTRIQTHSFGRGNQAGTTRDEGLAKQGGVPLSIDTCRSAVAKQAIDVGAEMINDISGLHGDPALAQVAAKRRGSIILMHIRGTPETMQKDVHYESLFSEILLFLEESIEKARVGGCRSEPNCH